MVLSTTVGATPSPGPPAQCAAEVRIVSAPVPNPGDVTRDTLVTVEVRVGPDGKADEARIQRSSYDVAIDRAALYAAVHATYSPKSEPVPLRRQAANGDTAASDGVMCKPVTGTYLFSVHFRAP